MSDGLTFRRETHGAAAVLRVFGEVDIYNAARFDAEIAAAQVVAPSAIVVDLRQCRYIDSSGIRVLARLGATLGNRLFIAVAKGSCVGRVFEITGLARYLQVLPNDEIPRVPPRAPLAAEFPV
jgi:anti-anti-sigma factor